MMEGTQPKPFVFVLMPFNKKFDDVYEVGIKATCQAANVYCERVDEQIFEGKILERVYNQIAKADIIIAEMTGRNPNVFYETGYAHALNKRVLLLTQRAKDIPFDLLPYPHIVYGTSIASLRDQLRVRLEWCIANPQGVTIGREFSLKPYFGGSEYRNDILRTSLFYEDYPDDDKEPRWVSNMAVDFHNPTDRPYIGGGTVTLITPRLFDQSSLGSAAALPDNTALHTLGDIPKILPEGWIPFRCDLYAHKTEARTQLVSVHQIAIRVFTDFGTVNFPLQWQPS